MEFTFIHSQVPLRRRGPGDDSAAAPAEPADDAADGAHDRGRLQVGRGAFVAASHQAAQVEGGEQRRRYQGSLFGNPPNYYRFLHLALLQSWPVTLDTDDTRKGRLPGVYRAPTAEMLSYLDFSVSTTGMLAGIKMSHASTTALCRLVTLNHQFD